jgi:hypothetical protein
MAVAFVLSQTNNLLGLFTKDKSIHEATHYALLILGITLVCLQFLLPNGLAPSLIWGSFQPLYQNGPDALGAKFQQFCNESKDQEVCAAAANPQDYASKGTNYQYSYKLCLLSVFSKYEYIRNPSPAAPWETTTAFYRCQRLSEYWIDSMEWVKGNTEPNSRITSWWDYGHWINFFGERNAVIRNEHASHKMIGDVAHNYVDATPSELLSWMKEHDSKYALFDTELVYGGSSLGGKYGALNYLSCARDNDTSVAQNPGESKCEADHLWETIFISSSPCTISSLTNRTGYTAYKIYVGQTYLPYYPGFCVNVVDANVAASCRINIRAVPTYCVGNTTLATGESTYVTYYLNQTYPNGDLKLNKALLQLPYQLESTYHMGSVTSVTLFYTNDKIWLENGEIKSGYEDRKGKFYDSSLYHALFLNELPGFRLVYSSPTGAVKIYKINDDSGFTANTSIINIGSINT